MAFISSYLFFNNAIRSLKFLQMSQSIEAILPLIGRYHKSAARLASMQLQSKSCAQDVVTLIFEELFEEKKLSEGPHLRPLLILRIRWACRLINKLSRASQYHPLPPLFQFPTNNKPSV